MILAVDPSIVKTGYAVFATPNRIVVSVEEFRSLYVASGVVKPNPKAPDAERIAFVGAAIRELAVRDVVTHAFVEVPEHRKFYHGKTKAGRTKGQAEREGALADLAKMHMATGHILGVLYGVCRVETIPSGTVPKDGRRVYVAQFWPELAGKRDDEVDAVYHAAHLVADHRRRWAARG